MGQDFECEKCNHYPWMSKIFTEVNGVEYVCKCNCHDAEFEKHKIYFTIGENGTWESYGNKWSKGKIITKKQWDQHLTKYGDGAIDEARKQGIAGYKDEGVREKRPEAFTDVGSNRLDIDGKYIYYIEIVKLIVCSICRKSQFEDAVLFNLHRTSYNYYVESETCLSEHKHEYWPCPCGRKICQITFRDYFGYDFPNRKYGSGGGSSDDDLQKIEKLWGSHPSNHTPSSGIHRHFDDRKYRTQYLDVFQLAVRSDGKTDEVVGIRRTRL
jgi:hypothetical protein